MQANHTPTDATMSTTPTPATMLRHLYTSCRKTQLHLIAYSAATATPEQVAKNDVPDYEYYEFEQDRAMTDEMLRIIQELLAHMEQHLTTYYPDQPAFEDTNADTLANGEYSTPRLHNAGEAALWVIAAFQISQAYHETLPSNTQTAVDAGMLAEEVENLLGTIDEHGNEYTLSRGTHPATWFEADAYLDEMHPIYTELSTERANRD